MLQKAAYVGVVLANAGRGAAKTLDEFGIHQKRLAQSAEVVGVHGAQQGP